MAAKQKQTELKNEETTKRAQLEADIAYVRKRLNQYKDADDEIRRRCFDEWKDIFDGLTAELAQLGTMP